MKEKGKQPFFRFPLMALHLLKTSPHGKRAVICDCLSYIFRSLQWRASLAIIQPLNRLRETSWLTVLRKKIARAFFTACYFESRQPANLEATRKRHFQKDFYLLKPLKIIELKDYMVYLTAYHGIAFKNFKILPESIHGKWDKRNVTLLRNYFPLVMNSWLYAHHEKGGSMTILKDDGKYLLCHHWFNYYHWLTETVLRLWTVKDRLNDYVLLLPESLREITFVQQSLESLQVKNIQYVKEGIVQAHHLTVVENKPYCNHYFPDIAAQIRNYFSDYVKHKHIAVPDFGDKIFVSRKKAVRRKLVNEAQVEQLLSGYGFQSVAFEDFDFFQQVAILSRAKYLIGMHGAGLTNMLFMPAGGSVLEFHREIYSRNDLHSDVYWKLAAASGHQYCCQFCEPASKEEDFFTVDYSADISKLRSNLNILLK